MMNNLNELDLCNDLTMTPNQLDTQFEQFGYEEIYGGVLRNIVIKVGDCLSKTFKPNLLSSPKITDFAEMHVIVGSTHCFKKSVMNSFGKPRKKCLIYISAL